MDHGKPEIKRPWGGYTILKKTKFFWIKKLYINKGNRLSLQSHRYRSEVWIVLDGNIDTEIGTKHKKLKPGDVAFIPQKRKHRITGITNACVLEVAFGHTLENDIIRYKDDYGRV